MYVIGNIINKMKWTAINDTAPFFTRFSLAGLNFPRGSITRLTLRINTNQFLYRGVSPVANPKSASSCTIYVSGQIGIRSFNVN